MRKQSQTFLAVLASCAIVPAIAGTVHACFPGRNGLIAFQSQTSTGLQIFTVVRAAAIFAKSPQLPATPSLRTGLLTDA